MPIKQDNIKNIFWILFDAVLAVAVVLGLLAAAALWQYGKSVVPSRAIAVNAEGKVVVIPDIARVSFSAVSEGKDPAAIQTDNNKKINSAIEFVKTEGVDPKDIKTAGYDLSPRYEYDEKRRTSFISGYTLTQTVSLKIRDFSKIGKIIGALPGLGINQIGSLSFDVDDPDKFLNEARKEAFEKARAKADAMASYSGVKIRRVVNFSEYGGGYPVPLFAKAEVFGGAVSAPTIEPGSQEVTVQVNVTYEIW